MKINNENLKALKEMGIKVPSYHRESLKRECVHIGLGHFHRSHFLTYMDKLLDAKITDSGVFEIDIVPSNESFISSLESQDYMYSLSQLSPDGKCDFRINGAIIGYANQTKNPEIVEEVLSSAETKLITLTITEKGYCYLDQEGTLDWNNPSVSHDINTSETPKSAVGVLAKALYSRYKNNLPVTVMSCDNVPENGKMLKKCVLQFTEKKYPEMLDWLKENVAFPCTMVDRITPGTSKEDIEKVEKEFGVEDKCAVHSESYMEWVIEDSKTTVIPDFASAGALVVKDVKPYELMKIRLLNGAHSALSYPSYMCNIKMVHEAALDKDIRHFIRDGYMEEMTDTLSPVPGVDLNRYKDQLIERFSNPYIADTILRLASDGSKKIANAIIRPLEETLRDGKKHHYIITSLALWQYFYSFKDKEGNPMPLDDPKAETLKEKKDDAKAFLLEAGLDNNYASDELIKDIEDILVKIKKNGIRSVLA